jgi:GNAT superfamily N-acetyltransferase
MQQRLYEATIPESIPEEYRPKFEAAMRVDWVARYIDEWGREEDTAQIIEVDGEPAGAAWYRHYEPHEMHQLQRVVSFPLPPHEIAMGLAKPWRGRGLGTSLLDSLVKVAAAENITQLCLSVSTENPAAQRLYRRIGFVPIGAGFKSEVMLWETT